MLEFPQSCLQFSPKHLDVQRSARFDLNDFLISGQPIRQAGLVDQGSIFLYSLSSRPAVQVPKKSYGRLMRQPIKKLGAVSKHANQCFANWFGIGNADNSQPFFRRRNSDIPSILEDTQQGTDRVRAKSRQRNSRRLSIRLSDILVAQLCKKCLNLFGIRQLQLWLLKGAVDIETGYREHERSEQARENLHHVPDVFGLRLGLVRGLFRSPNPIFSATQSFL